MRNLPERRQRFMQLRIYLLYACVLVGAATVLRRAYDLQVSQAPRLREMAEEQHSKQINVPPKRGTLRDRNGAELAISVEVDSVYANPRRIAASGQLPAHVAARLSHLLGVDAQKLTERLSAKRYFVWVKRRLTPKESQAVRQLRIEGVELVKEPRRYYPGRELAASVIGFANVDGKGIEGIELALDERLRGATKPVSAIRDRRGQIVFSEHLLDDRAAQGDDVVLTLDRTIQHVAERELELAVRTFEARAGSVVVLEPSTGEVLAMANFPTFNPNEPANAPPSHHRNRAVSDRFEPGSTTKPFTVAGALSAGTLRAGQRIDCEDGAMQVGEYTIHDTHGWEDLSLGEILAFSSNIGTAKIGLGMGRERLYRTLRDFGFGATTDVGLPGETAATLRHWKRWYEMDAATISFGQGMSATALQLATAFGALANGGRLMRPMLVKRFEGPEGERMEERVPSVRRQVVPSRVAKLVTDMLTSVTGENGTGFEAALPGHLVAGKTGTAQKADYVRGGYAEGKWISSFIGYAPAERPRLVVGVVIDEPMIAHYGGTVAGTTFRRVMDAGLRHLGVVARAPAQEPVAARKKKAAANAAEAASAAARATNEVEASQALTGPAPAASERRVPDLLGQTARKALVLSQRAELVVRLDGSGLVVEQTPAPGDVVEKGATIHVRLKPPFEPAPEGQPVLPELIDSETTVGAATQTGARDEPTQAPPKARAPVEGRDG